MSKPGLSSAFYRLWTASLATNFGDGLLKVAGPLLAAYLTRDPVLISLTGALATLPWLLIAIPVGGLADRHDRRLLLAAANTARFLIAAVIATLVYLDLMNIWLLLGALFLWGVCEVVMDTTANALMPQLMKASQLEKGNTRLNLAETVVQDFVAVPISGLIYAVAIALPFAIGSLGFLAGALLVLLIPAAQTAHGPREDGTEHHTFVEDMKFGVKFLAQDRELRRVVLVTAFIGFFYNLSNATFVLFVLDELKMPERLFGVVMTVIGTGAFVGTMATTKFTARLGRGTTMAWAITLASLGFAFQGASPNYAVMALLGWLGVFAISSWNPLLMACYQVLIPKHLYGRVHGARRTLVWGLGPFGMVIGGFVSNYGLRWPFLIGGLGSTVLALANFRFFQALGDRASSIPDEA